MSFGWGWSLLKHDLDKHEIVAPVSNKDIALLSVMVTGKFATYFMLLMVTLTTSPVNASHSELDGILKLLLGLSELGWLLPT